MRVPEGIVLADLPATGLIAAVFVFVSVSAISGNPPPHCMSVSVANALVEPAWANHYDFAGVAIAKYFAVRDQAERLELMVSPRYPHSSPS
jgi:hypothetical protein